MASATDCYLSNEELLFRNTMHDNNDEDEYTDYGRLPDSLFIVICASGIVTLGVVVVAIYRYLF